MEQWRRERPDLDPSPMGVIGRLHRLATRCTTELRPVFAEAGLSDGDFDVLASLRRAGAPYQLTPGELAASTMVTSGAVTKRRRPAASEQGYVTRTRQRGRRPRPGGSRSPRPGRALDRPAGPAAPGQRATGCWPASPTSSAPGWRTCSRPGAGPSTCSAAVDSSADWSQTAGERRICCALGTKPQQIRSDRGESVRDVVELRSGSGPCGRPRPGRGR